MPIKVVIEDKPYGSDARVRIGNRICNRQIASFLLTGASATDRGNASYSNEGIFSTRFTTLSIGQSLKRFDWARAGLEMRYGSTGLGSMMRKDNMPDVMRRRLDMVFHELNPSIGNDVEFVFTKDFDEYIKKFPETLEAPVIPIRQESSPNTRESDDRWDNLDL